MVASSPFTAGPRLVAEPVGDPSAQAIASLRGYAYQLYASASAWLVLRANEELYLEVAKDYAVTAGNALRAVEVKDTKSAGVTINSQDVRDTLDTFVDLVGRNPDREVSLHFLSTSTIVFERKRKHRTGDVPVLHYWREAARGADLGPLRSVLAKIDLRASTRAFIDARDDDALRRDFLRRLHWDCGQPDLNTVKQQVEAALGRYAKEHFQVPAMEIARLAPVVLAHVLTTTTEVGSRRLIDSDLFRLVEAATRVSVSRHDVDVIFRQAATALEGEQAAPVVEVASNADVLESEDAVPLPTNLANRATMVGSLSEMARANSIVFVTGATGTGKTIAARLTARALAGRWFVVDLRNATPDQIKRSLRAALGSLSTLRPGGVILNDFNEIEDADARAALVRFVEALRHRDAFCLLTAYRVPSARAMSELGVTRAAHFIVPDLTVEEVCDLVAGAGGEPTLWGKAVRMAGAFGHPQLVQAVIFGLQTRSWPKDELQQLMPLIRSDDVEAERLATRQRLVGALPEGRRLLLYRLSLLIGRFDRALAVSLGAVAPAIPMPGEQLDALVGPWIDRTAHDQLRVSPLLSGAGRQTLTPQEQKSIHFAAAEGLASGRKIDVATADSAFLHALLGKSERVLTALGIGILRADEETMGLLAEWLTGIRLYRTDQPIYPDRPSVSHTLRLAQVLLVAEKGHAADIRESAKALFAEIDAEIDAKVKDHFEYLALFKLLISRSAASLLPDWVGLLLKFDRLTSASAERRKLIAQASKGQDGKPASTPLGMFFILQMMGVASVAELAGVFDRLDQVTEKERARLFSDVFNMPSDFALIVNRAWLEEHKRGNADWLACAARYHRMAGQAEAWGYRELALRCHVARGVMLDEYAEDPTSALAALDEAARQLGADPVLSRARAKILYRRKDHLGALQLLREASQSTALNDPIERATMLREAGISAAEIGEWAEAQKWFGEARDASAGTLSPEMIPMTVGLRADTAVAAYKSGDPAKAVAFLAQTVEELASLDPDASIKSAYCHRVVRHTALWLFGEATDEEMRVGNESVAMVPGMCSNPEPSDVRDLPLGPLDLIWYLLAEAELAFGVDVGVEKSLRSRLKGRAIPAFELGLRKVRLDALIRQFDLEGVLGNLPGWVDAQMYLTANADLIRVESVMNASYGEIDPAPLERLREPAAAVVAEDLILAFGMFAWLNGRQEALAQLVTASETLGQYPGKGVARILGGARAGEQWRDQVATCLHAAISSSDWSPDELFVACLRFAEFAKRSNFKKLVSSRLVRWVRSRWEKVLKDQRFLLRNPMTTAGPILEALELQDESLHNLGALLLAAEPAVAPRLGREFRAFLGSL